MEKGKLNVHDLETVSYVGNMIVQLHEEFKTYFEEVEQDFNLLAGHIYTNDDLIKLGIEKRPAFEINLFLPLITKVVGDFKNNMPALDYLGRNEQDNKKADWVKEIEQWIFYTQNDIEYELAKAFLFAVVGRRSWLKQDYSFRKEPKGSIEIEHYHPFLKFDTSMRNRDMSSCQFISDEIWLTPDEIKRIYASNNPELADAIDQRVLEMFGDATKGKKGVIRSYLEKLTGMILDYNGEKRGFDTNYSFNKNSATFDSQGLFHRDGRFKVADFYHRQDFPKLLITDRLLQKTIDVTEMISRGEDSPAQGQSDVWYDNAKLQAIRGEFPDQGHVIEQSMESKIIQTSVAPGMQLKLFEGPQLLQNGNFKFTMIEAYDYHPNNLETKSMVDAVKDSIKSYNQRDNTNLTYLMRTALGEWWVDEKYKNKVPDLQTNKIGQIKFVPRELIQGGGIQRIDPPPANNALERYMAVKQDETYTITGVTPNSMGRTEGEKSGRLYEARVQQSNIMQEWISENAHRAYIVMAKNNLYYMKNYMKQEIIMRITDENDNINFKTLNQVQPNGEILNNLQDLGEFDIVVSKVPYGKIAKEMERERGMELLNIVSPIPEMMPVTLLLFSSILKQTTLTEKQKILEVTDAIVEKVVQNILQPAGASPMEQKAMQIEMEGKVLANQKIAAETEKVLLENAQQQMILDDGIQLAEENAAAGLISNIFGQKSPQEPSKLSPPNPRMQMQQPKGVAKN